MPTTTKGRVVYDRRTHPFSWCDARRIAKALGRPYEPKHEYCFYSCFRQLLSKMPRIDSSEASDARDVLTFYVDRRGAELVQSGQVPADFGGGEFGGAGASRPFFSGFFSGPIVPGGR